MRPLDETRCKAAVWSQGRWSLKSQCARKATIDGWCSEIREAWANDLYAVLVRPVETRWGKVWHLAIRTASNLEPPWRDKQRIKNEIFGQDISAVEIMPPSNEVIDQADMYHIWVLPEGFELPFSIFDRRHEGPNP
jgi:hypothetical protein